VIGATLLALTAYLFLRRHHRKVKKALPQVEPFLADAELGREITAMALPKEKSEIRDELLDLRRNMGERTLDETARAQGDSRSESRMGNERSNIDILRIFEDRTFEPHLLRLISQRMDPPPNFFSNRNRPTIEGGDGLPAYDSFAP